MSPSGGIMNTVSPRLGPLSGSSGIKKVEIYLNSLCNTCKQLIAQKFELEYSQEASL